MSKNSGLGRGGDTFKVKLPYFEEKDDLETYLRQFERVAKLQNWPEEEWATRLGTLLKGKAREVYTRLSDEDATDFRILRSALLQRFCITAEEYRRKFRTTRKNHDESQREFAVRQQLYFDRWRELSEKNETFEDVRDLLLQEQFLQNAPTELITFVRDRKPKNMVEVIEHAQTYEESRSMPTKTSRNLHVTFNGGMTERG